MLLDLIEKDFFSIRNDIGRNVIIFGVDMSTSTKIDNIFDNLITKLITKIYKIF